MSLRSFVRGRPVTQTMTMLCDAESTASALLRSVDRAAGRLDARELGLMGLAEAVAVPRDVEELAVYALVLAGLAERPFTRVLAIDLAARRAEVARTGAHAGHGRTIDWMALTIGLLRAGQTIAVGFTRERVLFRRLLGDNAVVRARQARHVDRIGALQGLLLDLVARAGDTEMLGDLPFFRFFAATEAMTIVGEQMQMMGGTGFMKDSGMPGVRDTILGLIERHRPELLLSDADLHAWIGGELPAWASSESREGDEPAGERQRDLLSLLPRYAAACVEASAPLAAATG